MASGAITLFTVSFSFPYFCRWKLEVNSKLFHQRLDASSQDNVAFAFKLNLLDRLMGNQVVPQHQDFPCTDICFN